MILTLNEDIYCDHSGTLKKGTVVEIMDLKLTDGGHNILAVLKPRHISLLAWVDLDVWPCYDLHKLLQNCSDIPWVNG